MRNSAVCSEFFAMAVPICLSRSHWHEHREPPHIETDRTNGPRVECMTKKGRDFKLYNFTTSVNNKVGPMSAVETSFNNGIFEITLNRPKQLNALNRDMLEQLLDVTAQIETNRDVRCVIIRGGGNHFMAGGDIAYFHQSINESNEYKVGMFNQLISNVHLLVERLAALPAPVIASVRGAAAGFGISLVAGCDLAIASNNSFYTSAYNLLGTSPDGGSTYYLPRSVGSKKAMEIILLTKRYSAEEALRMGLINSVVDDHKLESETRAAAQVIANSARNAVSSAKQMVRQSLQNDLNNQLLTEMQNFLKCAASQDFTEGVRAFIEKRKPKFAD